MATIMNQLPRIIVLGTGGTIAGLGENAADAIHYQSAQLPIEQLLMPIRGLLDADYDVYAEQFSQLGSENFTPALWLSLTKRIQQAFDDECYDGVVVLHGTDTMEETAYCVHLLLKSERPVVFTGSMRPTSALSSDAMMNIVNAVRLAGHSSTRGRGVLVCMADEIHSARDVTKSHTTQVTTFQSPNTGPLGVMSQGVPTWLRCSIKLHTLKTGLVLPSDVNRATMPEVGIIYAYTGMTSSALAAFIRPEMSGLVMMGVGHGNLPLAIHDALRQYALQGVILIRSSRVYAGGVSASSELTDAEVGTIAAGDLNPQKSRVLLIVCLLNQLMHSAIEQSFRLF